MPEKPGRAKTKPLKILPLLAVPLLDQWLKGWVLGLFQPGETRPFLPPVVHLTLVHNTGTAFGLFPNANFAFMILSIGVMVFLLVLLSGERRIGSSFAISLLIGGAVGNLIDRIRLGYVVDFIDLRFWPVFNLADSCITIGIVWLLLGSFKK